MKLCLNCLSDEVERQEYQNKNPSYVCKDCQYIYDASEIEAFSLFFAGYTYATRGNTVYDLPKIDKKTALSEFKRLRSKQDPD